MLYKKVGKAMKAIFSLAIAVMIVFGAFQLIKFVSGSSSPICVVVSPSMVPTLNVGDIVFVKQVNPSNLKVGDIIVFHKPTNPNDLIVHRIYSVSVSGTGIHVFRTKGDANMWPDSWLVPENMVEGKVVFTLPYIGWINIVLQPPLNYLLITVLVFMLIANEVSGESTS